ELVPVEFDRGPVATTFISLASAVVLILFAALGMLFIALADRQWMSALFTGVFIGVLVGGGVWYALPIFQNAKWWVIECGIDPWPIATTYIGLALAGAMFLSIGLFVSSMVN